MRELGRCYTWLEVEFKTRSSHISEGEQNLPPQNIPLGHTDFFRLIIFKTTDAGKSQKTAEVRNIFVGNIYSYKGNLHV